MASLSNINGLFDVHSTGAILFSNTHGTSGQILKSNGNAAPTWVAASTVIGGPYLPLTGGTLSGPLSGTSATFSGNVACGDPAGANTGVRIYYGAGTGDYGSIRFYSNAINTNTIHVFSDNWQSGTIFTKSSGAINIDGNSGVTFGAWTSVDVAFKSGGPNYFRGNVGIGTSTPNYKLSVANASTRIISATYIDGANGIMSHAGAPNYGLESFQIRGDFISFWTDYDASHYQGLERMRITSSGALLVGGTASPSTSWKGTAVFGQQGTSKVIIGYLTGFSENIVGGHNSNLTAWDSLTVAGADLKFRTGAGAADTSMTIDISGNVGIGTDSPDATLDVHAPSTTAPSLTMGAAAGQIFKNEDLEFAFGLNNASPYNGWMQTRFAGNGSRSFSINPLGGNVGIGTNSPSDKLSVYNGSYAVNIGGYSASWVGNSVYPTIYSSSSDRWIMITSPHIPYLENGVDGYTGSTAGSRIRFASDSGSGIVAWDAGVPHYGAVDTFTIGRNSVPFVTVKNNGRVGIGTTTPRAKLEVAGDITIQNGVYTYKTNGYTSGASAINVDITVGNEGGAGNVFKIEAGFAHYYGMAYNSIGEWWCTSRGATVINTYILNAGTSLAGTWSSSKPNTTTLRVTKSAGTYGGGGKWWVKVTYVPF